MTWKALTGSETQLVLQREVDVVEGETGANLQFWRLRRELQRWIILNVKLFQSFDQKMNSIGQSDLQEGQNSISISQIAQWWKQTFLLGFKGTTYLL